MIEQMCQRPGCGIYFVAKAHNQRYHNSECTRLATNQRIMDNYYKQKERKAGKKRVCEDCKSLLSRYNEDTRCSMCKGKSVSSDRAMVDIIKAQFCDW